MLSPLELGARLDRILAGTGTLVGSLSVRTLDHGLPQGDGSVRDLAFRVFRLSLAYVDGMDIGHLPEAWLHEKAPTDLIDGPAIVRYGALVRGRIAGWFEGAGASEYARTIRVSDGPQNGHDLLEKTVVMAAQHLRRLHALAARLEPMPPPPLLPADFDALPLPASPWP